MGIFFIIVLILFILGFALGTVNILQCILGIILLAAAWWLWSNHFWKFW